MTTIPLKQREEMRIDPFYSCCALFGHHGHICGGRITWEHALRCAGRKVQKKFAIIGLCARGHEVDEYQDAGTMNKEMNEWVALSRATPLELDELSKAMPARQRLAYLEGKYGKWTWISPFPPGYSTNGINYGYAREDRMAEWTDRSVRETPGR